MRLSSSHSSSSVVGLPAPDEFSSIEQLSKSIPELHAVDEELEALGHIPPNGREGRLR